MSESMLDLLRAEAEKARAEGRNLTIAPEIALSVLKRLETADVNAAYAVSRLAAVDAERLAQMERAEQAEADSAAWWQIVSDLDQLGCLDCSNNACDRARDALGAGHPGAALLAELAAAPNPSGLQQAVEAIRKERGQ